MINALEEEVGFPLFIRTKKGVSPTENGKAMIPAFREIVRAHNHALEIGADIRGILSGALTIGSYYSVSAMWLPPILKGFRQLYPNVRIDMKEGGNREMTRWLNEMSVDCCFFAGPSSGTVCDWISIRQDELLAWLPKNHPGAGETSFPLCALENEPFIITMPNQDTETDAYTTYCMVEELP